MSKIFEINEKDIEKQLLDKLKTISNDKLFIAEDKLREHLTENEILELFNKGILSDKSLE